MTGDCGRLAVWAVFAQQKRFTGIVAEKLWLGIWEVLEPECGVGDGDLRGSVFRRGFRKGGSPDESMVLFGITEQPAEEAEILAQTP